MGSRRKARVLAFQALFCLEANPGAREGILEFPWLDDEMRGRYEEDTLVFARMLIAGALEHREEIDKKIESRLEHWDIHRLGKVDLAILRISAYALLFQKEIPATVTIDEAVDIAKDYGSDESYRFINGVLDGIRKSDHEE